MCQRKRNQTKNLMCAHRHIQFPVNVSLESTLEDSTAFLMCEKIKF